MHEITFGAMVVDRTSGPVKADVRSVSGEVLVFHML